jgi:hypothetical protein
MTMATSVSGLVLDESGEPVAGVQIMALRQGSPATESRGVNPSTGELQFTYC